MAGLRDYSLHREAKTSMEADVTRPFDPSRLGRSTQIFQSSTTILGTSLKSIQI